MVIIKASTVDLNLSNIGQPIMKAITLNEFGLVKILWTSRSATENASFCAEHEVRPVIDSSYEFTDATKAIEALPHNNHFGKIAVSF